MLDAFPGEIRGYSQSGKWKNSSKWYRNILKLYYNYAVLQFCWGCWLNLPSNSLLSKELASALRPHTRERLTVLGGSPGTIYGAAPWGVRPASTGAVCAAGEQTQWASPWGQKFTSKNLPIVNSIQEKADSCSQWTHGISLYSAPELRSSTGINNKQGILYSAFELIKVSGPMILLLTLSHSHCFDSSRSLQIQSTALHCPWLCTYLWLTKWGEKLPKRQPWKPAYATESFLWKSNPARSPGKRTISIQA